MKKTLGILVATSNNMNHLIALSLAAQKAGIHTDIFFTGEGVRLIQDCRFEQLLKLAGRIGICEVSFRSLGYKKEFMHGLTDKDFVTQARNADMVRNCDRYVVL